MADKRIIELTEKATVDNSDYLIVDNSNGGTKKLQIATLLGSIDKLKKEVVQTLPIQDIDENTIYLVPKQTAGTQNVYDEYMYINNAWEQIGSTEVDLSNYQTKTDNDLLTTSKQIVGAINELLTGKEDKATIKTATLAASATTITFTGIPTTGNNTIELYTSKAGLDYSAVDDSVSGSLTYTFEAQSAAVTCYLVIREVD